VEVKLVLGSPLDQIPDGILAEEIAGESEVDGAGLFQTAQRIAACEGAQLNSAAMSRTT
jgi:hypothetical protein